MPVAVLTGQSPAPNATGVSRTTSIVLTAGDLLLNGTSGIPSSIQIYVSFEKQTKVGGADSNTTRVWRSQHPSIDGVPAAAATWGWTGSRSSRTFTLQNSNGFKNYSQIHVTVAWTYTDSVTFVTSSTETNYHFWIVDSVPTLVSQSPVDGAFLDETFADPLTVTLNDRGDEIGATWEGVVGGTPPNPSRGGSGIDKSSINITHQLGDGTVEDVCIAGVFQSGWTGGSAIGGGADGSPTSSPKTYDSDLAAYTVGEVNRSLSILPDGGWDVGAHEVVVEFADFAPNTVTSIWNFQVGRTFDMAIEARDQLWCALIRIEGIGEAAGQWGFATQIPAYLTALGKDWLVDWPTTISERITPMGGIPEAGELSVELLDFNNEITGKMRLDAPAQTQLNGAVSSRTATTITVYSSSGIVTGNVVFVDGEAMRVTAVPGGGVTLTVTRGWLDTAAAVHADGAHLSLYTPFIRGRRMRLSLVALDAESESEEHEFGSYYIDDVEMGEHQNTWIFRGKSELKHLGRIVAAETPNFQVVEEKGDARTFLMSPSNADPLGVHAKMRALWNDLQVFMQVDEEIVRISTHTLRPPFYATLRGMSATVQKKHEPGDVATYVLLADPTYGSFRYSPGEAIEPGATPSTSRGSGTWLVSSNWVDILLCMLTSSGHPLDGLELVNYDPAYGNWSSLPPGYGVGVPFELIDIASFIEVRERTKHWLFPGFAYGTEPVGFAELITKNFLTPLGAYLTSSSNRIRLVLPSVPITVAETTTFDDDIVKEVSRIAHDGSTVVTSIKVNHKTANGQESFETFNAASNPALGSQTALYSNQEPAMEIDVPGVFSDSAGMQDFLREICERRLFRFHKPQWRISLATDVSLYLTHVGDLVALTHSELPDLKTGARGWTAVIVEALERVLHFTPEFVGFDWTLIGYGPSSVRVGKIAPSIEVASVSGAGPYVITAAANKYSSPVAVDDIPVTDCQAFEVGDVVGLMSKNGVAIAGTATVLGTSATTVTVDANFSGGLIGTTILVFQAYATSVARQKDGFVYWADRTTRTIGASAVAPWSYGEP